MILALWNKSSQDTISGLSVPWEKKSPWLRQYQSYISYWCINGKVFKSTTAWKAKNLIFFKAWNWILTGPSYPMKRNHPGFFNISPTLVIDTSLEKGLHEYYSLETQNLEFFFRKFKIESWLVPKSWNHLNFVNISTTLVIDASMDRSLCVVQHGIPNIWIFWKSLKLNLTCIMTCDEELKSTFK